MHDPPADLAAIALDAEVDAAGVIAVARRDLPARFVAIASLCAAGTTRPPRTDRLDRITALLAADAPFVATLCGARIEADGDAVRFMREAGDLARAGCEPLQLGSGEQAVWDGRFEIAAARPTTIVALSGHAARLSSDQAASLRAVPAKARAALPVALGDPPSLLADALCLVRERLLAACGAIDREPID